MARLLLVGAACCALLVQDRPVFRSAARTVYVYATVQGKDGRLVTNLTRDDFEIFDNGRPQAVTMFENEPQKITMVLLFDMSASMVKTLPRLREAAVAFVRALWPDDRVRIGSFGDEVALSPILTSDQATLLRILDEELWPGGSTPLWRAIQTGMNSLESEPGRRVVLTFTDGKKADVTWLTKFDSNDATVATVDAKGRVKAKRNGATSIRAAMLTEVGVAVLAVPFEKAVDDAKFAAKNNFIDAAVLDKLKALRIEPAGLSEDAEFLRRVYLDATGTLPTAEAVRAFLADKATDKRAKAIDKLLDTPEFIDYWTLFLSDLLQNRKERDHDERSYRSHHAERCVRRLSAHAAAQARRDRVTNAQVRLRRGEADAQGVQADGARARL